MKRHDLLPRRLAPALAATLALLALAPLAPAQTPLYDDAPVVVEALDADELQTLVGPVALYPDDLLAVVLPASAYPLQIVKAARFLDELEVDDTLKPDPLWDESVVALLNYPEVLRMMSDDLAWTQQLGDAMVVQQADVIAAIETFRDRAYDAGNLKSDARQRVVRTDDVIEITPVEREVIYVPYYEPERVVVVQREPVYHYYERPCPVYYYPYPSYHRFRSGWFFGVTSAYRIGWHHNWLNIHLHNYASHPYYGRRYVHHYYWHHRYQPLRYQHRPRVYSREHYADYRDRTYRGDRWRPRAGRYDERKLRKSSERHRVRADNFRYRPSQTERTPRRGDRVQLDDRSQRYTTRGRDDTRTQRQRSLANTLADRPRDTRRAQDRRRDAASHRDTRTATRRDATRDVQRRAPTAARSETRTTRRGSPERGSLTERRRAEPRVALRDRTTQAAPRATQRQTRAPERAARTERATRTERPARPAVTTRSTRGEPSARRDRAPRNERPARAERPSRAGNDDARERKQTRASSSGAKKARDRDERRTSRRGRDAPRERNR